MSKHGHSVSQQRTGKPVMNQRMAKIEQKMLKTSAKPGKTKPVKKPGRRG